MAKPSGADGLTTPLFQTLFRQRALAQPEAMAIWFDEQSLDYRNLLADAEKLARGLLNRGLTPGSRVILMARPGLDYCRALVGILLARCAAVPLNSALPGDALTALIGDARPGLIFADSTGQQALSGIGYRGPHVGLGDARDGTEALRSWLDDASTHAELPAPQGSDLFSIIYSSGTTGIPKGIAHDTATRSNFFALGASGGAARTLLSTALYTNASFCTLVGTLYLGGTCFIQERFDVESFIDLVERQRIERCFLVPVQIKRIIDSPAFTRESLRSLKATVMSGSSCPLALKRTLAATWPGDLLENYGLSEGGILTTLNVTQSPDKLDTVGQLLPGYEMRILGEDDQPLPVGADGEILGRSPYMMQGYFNRDDLTEAMLWRDPEGRLFQRTGDIGHVDASGHVVITDRKKDVIISGGMNIYATEIDQLLEQHPAVTEAAVVAGPSERWGETPVAFVVCQRNDVVDGDALLEWINARLAREMRVSAIHFVDALPRNAMGKVVKRELRERLRQVTSQG